MKPNRLKKKLITKTYPIDSEHNDFEQIDFENVEFKFFVNAGVILLSVLP